MKVLDLINELQEIAERYGNEPVFLAEKDAKVVEEYKEFKRRYVKILPLTKVTYAFGRTVLRPDTEE